ncbi:MAG: S8 family serine peptidase [Candidatus Puniceispirillaceae bacterium]
MPSLTPRLGIFAALVCLAPAFCLAAPDRTQLCELVSSAEKAGKAQSAIAFDDGFASILFRPSTPDWRFAKIDFVDEAGLPEMQIRVLPPCHVTEARRVSRTDDGAVSEIEILSRDLATVSARQLVNPPVPELVTGDGTALLAHVDTGVNYLLPDVKGQLAADREGRLLGYDFWDDDDRPYDADPRRDIFFPQHHGTTTFSLLAREAGGIPIAVYRFPAEDMCGFDALISHMAGILVRVVSLSMGSSNHGEWRCFEKAARRHPQMLFIVSAGNDGVDLDQTPVYPAALPLDNLLAVTSSDDFGRLGRGSNSGASTVDLMVPAERVEVIDHRGARSDTGGTSYAAPRLAALAARFLRANPQADTPAIIEFLVKRARPAGDAAVKYGWIPDPTDNFGF